MSKLRLSNFDLTSWVVERITESDTLEFKSRKIATKELDQAIRDLAAEVSAFANSAGGVLAIGIEESSTQENGPTAERIEGFTDGKWRAEWLMSKLEGKISPPISGLLIYDVPLEAGGWCIIIDIPRSSQAPHQSVDRKYYARRQFQKLPMAHYEVEDVRNRQRVGGAQVRFELFIDRSVFVELSSENYGDAPVFDLYFQFDVSTKDLFKLEAPVFETGMTALNPGEVRRFYIGPLMELFSHQALRNDTKIDLFFRTETGEQESRSVYFNLNNYDRSSSILSDIDRLSQTIEKQVKELTESVKSVGNILQNSLATLCDNTGLALSFDTLKRLGYEPTPNTKWDPTLLSWRGFVTILDCSAEIGIGLQRYFSYIGQGIPAPAELEGMTPELLQLIGERLKFGRQL
jgi:hypothetical protein